MSGYIQVYNWRNVVIGGNSDAISYANETGFNIIHNTLDDVFPFDSTGPGECLELESPLVIDRRNVLYDLNMRGLSPFSNLVSGVLVDLKESQLRVSLKNNLFFFVNFEKLYVFDTTNVVGLPVEVPEVSEYRVFDWFDVKSGMKHDLGQLSYNSDFVKEIYFYISPRIDGNKILKDLVVESLLTGEYVEGIYGVTYAPNRYEGPYGRFFADYFDDMNSLTERLEIVSENNRFPNDVAQLQSAVEEQMILPHPGGESPNTIMDVDDLSGGRKRRRKRKTHKKKTRRKKNRKRRTKKKSRRRRKRR